MTIGQSGKQAQHFGQHRQNQYQLDYRQADTLRLTPPRRRQVQATPQYTRNESVAQQQISESTGEAGIQRSSPQLGESAQTQTVSVGDIVQREETRITESQNSGGDFVHAVADQVFKLLLADIKKDRERNGGRFR